MTTERDIKDIPDGKPVRVFIPLLNVLERYRLQGIYRKSTLPRFDLLFQPGSLPVDVIDIQKSCIISVDMGGPSISVEAMISEIVNPQQLNMIVQKSISHEQMREFFRVDAVTKVISSSFHTQFTGNGSQPWIIQGETIDISGSGILALFESLPPADKQVNLEITIPSAEPEVIKAVAHPVRTNRLQDNRYEVAYHFDDISVEDRDKIIGCCLVLQRKLLRLKVHIQNS